MLRNVMLRNAVTTAVACAGAVAVGAVAAAAAATPDLGSLAGGSAGAAPVWQIPASSGPVQLTHAAAADYADANPGSVPIGTNDFSCVPTSDHPNPVILAHGSDSNSYSDWAALAPILKDDGYCVFALDYGGAAGDRAFGAATPGAFGTATPGAFGTEDMYVSAGQVGEFVGRVRSATGAAKVDLVGFSQGATVTRYYVNRLGGADVVDRWVGLASPSYGGIFYGLVPVADAIPGGRPLVSMFTTTAVAQQAQGSDFLADLNGGGDTVDGVRYTTIGTRYDEMIQPYTNVALRGREATNILIQDRCPQNMTGHMNMVYDPFTLGLVRQALDSDGVGASIPAPTCTSVPIGTGMLGMIGR